MFLWEVKRVEGILAKFPCKSKLIIVPEGEVPEKKLKDVKVLDANDIVEMIRNSEN